MPSTRLDQKESYFPLVRKKALFVRHITKNTRIYHQRVIWQNLFKIKPK